MLLGYIYVVCITYNIVQYTTVHVRKKSRHSQSGLFSMHVLCRRPWLGLLYVFRQTRKIHCISLLCNSCLLHTRRMLAWLIFCNGCSSLATQPMLQRRPTWTELRVIVFKSIFNVDSKNVNKKFLHHHHHRSFFFKTYLGGPKKKIWKKEIFSVVTVEELFVYIFGIYIKNGFRNHQS